MVITNLSILRRRLLAWYDTNRRDLPWRRSADPYRIWLSEIMLQQTRVAAVREHYRAFLARFPTVDQLAAAPLASVLAAWSGLGYYRRARSLHRAARQIVHRHHSRLPRTLPELRALPSIGRYTGAALASIAFGVPVAAVDANVERVISRLLARPSPTRAACWTLAEALLARRRPGDWNQAMMELGATVCLPRQPRCQSCPLKPWCAATASFAVAEVKEPGSPTRAAVARGGVVSPHPKPGSAPRPASAPDSRRTPSPLPGRRRKCHEAYLLAQRGASVYLLRRASQARQMAGMWELPRLPAPLPAGQPLFRLKHCITVTDYEIAIFAAANSAAARPLDAAASLNGGRWVRLKRIPELPLTGLTRKVLRRAGLI
jgi:A/G-specific adenine glycosylase